MASSLQQFPTDHKFPPSWNHFLFEAKVIDPLDEGPLYIKYEAGKDAVEEVKDSNGHVQEPAKLAMPETCTCTSKKLQAAFGLSSNAVELTTPKLVIGDNVMLGLRPGPDVELGTASDIFELYAIDFSESTMVKRIVEETSKVTKVKLVYGTESAPLRNGIWFMPGENGKFELTTALTYKLSTSLSSGFGDALASIAPVFDEEYGLALSKAAREADAVADQSNITFKVQQTTTGTNISIDPDVLDLVISQTFRVIFSIKIKGFVFNIEYSPEGAQIDIREDTKVSGGLFDRIASLFGTSGSDPFREYVPPSEAVANPAEGTSGFSELHLWNIALGKIYGGGIWWVLSFALKWTAGSQDVWIGLSYDTRVGTFTGQLLFNHMFPDEEAMLLPYWSPLEAPPIGDELPSSLDLKQLFADAFSTNADSLPSAVPTRLTQATLQFNKLDKSLTLAATIQQEEATDDSSEIPAPFVWNDFSVEVVKRPGDTEAHILSSFTLHPLPADVDRYTAAQLAVDIRYSSGDWQFKGLVNDLQLGVLASYADADCSSAFVDVLGKLNVRKLLLDYTYTKDPVTRKILASSFLFMGKIELGQLELDLVYQFVAAQPSTGTAPKTAAELSIEKATTGVRPLGRARPLLPKEEKSWSFEAYLGATVSDAELGSIAESIMDGAAEALPSFVRNIKIGAASDPDTSPISLRVTKPDGDKSTVIFTLDIQIESVSLTFVQIASNSDRTVIPVKPPKRLLRVFVAKLPLVEDIPVVQELPQPFEQLQYVWVSEEGSAWTAGDIETANTVLATTDKLYYKQTNKRKEEGPKIESSDGIQQDSSTLTVPPTRPALATGHHFIVVNDATAVLDHVFHNANSKSRSVAKSAAGTVRAPPGDAAAPAVAPAGRDDVDVQPAPAPTKAALVKQTKLLSIEAIALQFKEGYLWVNVDATVNLGPVGMSLLGFGVGLPLSVPGVNLTLDKFDPQIFADNMKVRLNGMGVSFEKPPLTLAGVFEHEVSAFGDDSKSTKDSYRGGIGISFPPYTFVAVGEYSQVTLLDKEYKSVFVYAKLDGPLVTLEFATISGVRIGFGYNSSIRQPATIDEVNDFPLINDEGVGGTGNNPIKILKALTGGGAAAWVAPRQDAYWFAVGMTISSFDILSITACAIFAFKDSGIIIDLYANAIAQMPPGVPSSDTSKMILYVELDMHACMNFVDGYFLCEAALAPSSFLLVPQCHLYGGFALCYWFGNNPHAGDWVFSVGGYHRAFQRPEHYPNPKRLGISFVIGDNIQMRGEGYFAITPKAVMGGARIHISLDVGCVSAYLDAAFDALINFHPIHYMVDVHVAVGVSCNIDIGLIHIHISVSIGADLHIEGPEFGGVAHVDFWFFGFDLYFGSHGALPDPLSLAEFWEQVHKAGPAGGHVPAEDDTAQNLEVGLKHNLQTGNFPMPAKDSKEPTNAGAGQKWYVKGGSFSFRVSADFALSSAFVATEESEDAKEAAQDKISDAYTAKATAVQDPAKPNTSIFSVPMHVNNGNQHGGIKSVMYVTIYQKQKNGGKEVISGWKAAYVVKDVPSALWSEYDENNDAMRRGADTSKLLSPDGATIALPMGISLIAPDPVLALSKIPDFNATDMAKAQVKQKGGQDWLIPTATLYDEKSVVTFPAAPLSAAETDANGTKKWNAVKSVWQDSAKSGASIAASIASHFSSCLAWDQMLPGDYVRDDATPPKLNIGLPMRLVTGTGTQANADVVDGLENFYMTLPRLGVVAAT
ncbi:hypothetical protein TI39_contig350g00003 [Zymoseptoria brevis]|uniref:DUF6603 domain-containing protein n=1 Tax=Zymoseptoria brevis TaxID=1047168 RepID=A0A0F4GRI2_9PEZI|nr:hypothetical protein TI39_contig350g00003 [Zymoseptoria brevis]